MAAADRGQARVSVGVSLKMYFGLADARAWTDTVGDLVRATPAVMDGDVEFFAIPSYLAIAGAVESFAGTPALVGAQDVAADASGAFTGEVSGGELREAGVEVVEVGHAERRRLFGETDEVVTAKTAAALRNGIVPVLCLGESTAGDASAAALATVRQLHSALDGAPAGRVIVAYEPVWAIGAAEPAGVDHIRIVATALRAELDALDGRDGSTVIYGGSAGPGLLTELGDAVGGLFLGRFAHDPERLALVLAEAAALAASRSARAGRASG